MGQRSLTPRPYRSDSRYRRVVRRPACPAALAVGITTPRRSTCLGGPGSLCGMAALLFDCPKGANSFATHRAPRFAGVDPFCSVSAAVARYDLAQTALGLQR